MSETIQEVTGKTAGEYFVRLDALVAPGTVLYVYGGAAVALLGSAFLELVGALRLCLPEPTAEKPGLVLFKGANLMVRTGSAADLIASKLVRYDEQDQQDVQFLLKAGAVTLSAVRVYHGSKRGLEGAIRADRGNPAADFGAGFYLGDEKSQPLTLICRGENPWLYTCDLDLEGLRSAPRSARRASTSARGRSRRSSASASGTCTTACSSRTSLKKRGGPSEPEARSLPSAAVLDPGAGL